MKNAQKNRWRLGEKGFCENEGPVFESCRGRVIFARCLKHGGEKLCFLANITLSVLGGGGAGNTLQIAAKFAFEGLGIIVERGLHGVAKFFGVFLEAFCFYLQENRIFFGEYEEFFLKKLRTGTGGDVFFLVFFVDTETFTKGHGR